MSAPSQLVSSPLRLNLGCSDAHLKGWLNVDRVQPADKIADLSKHWPWAECSADEIKAWDIFEHMESKLFVMNEAYRVLKPGGLLDLFVPTTDGRGAFQDPTHRSFWTPNDLFYFCEEFAEWQRFHKSYGITARFHVIESNHSEFPNKVWKLRARLLAVKA